jgi:uncharacterized protein YcbK (DUF882 family)
MTDGTISTGAAGAEGDLREEERGTALLGRRSFLRLGAAAAASAALFDPMDALAASRAMSVRQVSLLNLHTGERLKAEYWIKGRYQNDVLSAVASVLRDHRTDERHPIDRNLLDLIHTLHVRMGRREPFHIISGYRSPATNRMLRAKSGGVAQNSYHMRGMAVDLRMPGIGTRQIYRAALRMRLGGAGFYPDSDFVHVDVGPVRSW